MSPRVHKLISPIAISFGVAFAQTPPKLSLQDAVAIAIKNHPQIQAAQHEVNFAQEQVVINRAPYFPAINGDITGSQGNDLSRIGAGELAASRLFNRFGQGVELSQLITDSGRTPNLVASARLQARASEQTLQATRYDVVLAVNRSYYNVLQAQAVVRVAEETVSARQLLSDQVTELTKNKLKSQLDQSFAEVQVSEAKLLLIRAQESFQAALALKPFAGKFASALFAIGLINASMLSAAILPLATAYNVCEGVGFESGIDRKFSEAPIFYGLYTFLIVGGAGVVLIPHLRLLKIILLSQVANGVLLPFVLIFMLVLINRTRIMGEYRNRLTGNTIAWSTAVVVLSLTAVMIWKIVFP